MKKFLIFVIRVYQFTISKLIYKQCRFYPSCSQYAIDAIGKYGLLTSIIIIIKRISKCHPFNVGGYDPVS